MNGGLWVRELGEGDLMRDDGLMRDDDCHWRWRWDWIRSEDRGLVVDMIFL